MAKRTDPHRPGAIIPADYEYALSFNLATTDGGWPIPSFGINCELDRRHEVDGKIVNGKHDPDGRCCTIGLRAVGGHRHALGGGPGRCTVCGAHYIYGDAWIHVPTGEIVFLGHDCAAKYSMLADRSAHELALGRLRQAAAVQLLKAQKAEARADFLAAHPGLAEALEGDNAFLRDLKAKFTEYTELSDKQVAAALRVFAESKAPREEEKKVPAPTGKTTFRGLVVSSKAHDTDYGTTIRVTVKVTTPDGVWLAWGTCPAAILDECLSRGGVKGAEVEITTTLEAGREPHFVFMKRPRGKFIAKAESEAAF